MLAALALVFATQRRVAITFDDAPNLNGDLAVAEQQRINTTLIHELVDAHVPAIAFVNEDKLLGDDDRPDPQRVAMIQEWLDGGFEIGNHTFSHIDLDAATAEQFEADVLRGEQITRPLDPRLQWFRHPYLDTGKTLAVRDEVDAFLAAHGYRVAPVTIDDSDWIYAIAYDRAAWWQREAVRRSYVRYMRRRVEWAESMSRLAFGREIAQILLLHESALNADTFPRLAAMLLDRGYAAIPISEAVLDSGYSSRDTWTSGGVTWLERWGVTRGIAASHFEHDPRVPPWVQRLAGARDE